MEEVLVIDDEPMILNMMESTLEMMGFSVTGATSVKEAVKLIKLKDAKFDALVTDYELGDGTGLEIISNVRAMCEDTPVILMTGSMKITKRDSEREGFSGYFHKPFSCIDLGKELGCLLRN